MNKNKKSKKGKKYAYLWLLIPGIVLCVISLVSLALGVVCWVSANNPGAVDGLGEAFGMAIAVVFVAVFSIYGFAISAVSALLGIPLLVSGIVKCKASRAVCAGGDE